MDGVLNLLVTGAAENGRILAASILHSRKCVDTEAKALVEALSSFAGGCADDLALFVEAVASCSPSTLAHNFTPWTQLLTSIMQTTTEPAVFQVAFRGVSTVVKQSSHCLGDQHHRGGGLSEQLSPLLHALLCFSECEATLQAMVLQLVAHCLVHFTSSCSKHRPSLKKWATTAAFNSHLPLSQEGSRVLVLLCRHSNQQWSSLLECVLTAVEWTLDQLHKSSRNTKSGREELPKILSTWLDVPALPRVDPERTASLVRLLAHLGRLLCYGLLFPPSDPSSLPPPVPAERILAASTRGLKPGPTGHVVEALVLRAALPLVHTTMWNILSVLIRTCHAHLLPYGGHMTSLLMTALCSRNPDQSPTLLAAVHRTLSVWVGVARDGNPSSMGPLLRSLLWSCSHAPFKTSSLETLCAVIGCVGPLVAPPLAASVLQVPMAGLAPHVPTREALPMLQLLMACVTSGNAQLCPPTSAAMQLLTDLVQHHVSREVVEFCQMALAQLSLSKKSSFFQSQPACNSPSPEISLVPTLAPPHSYLATPHFLPQLPPTPISTAPPTSVLVLPSSLPSAPPTPPGLAPPTTHPNTKRKRPLAVEEEGGGASASKRKAEESPELSGLPQIAAFGALGGVNAGENGLNAGENVLNAGENVERTAIETSQSSRSPDTVQMMEEERDHFSSGSSDCDSSDSETSGTEHFVAN